MDKVQIVQDLMTGEELFLYSKSCEKLPKDRKWAKHSEISFLKHLLLSMEKGLVGKGQDQFGS